MRSWRLRQLREDCGATAVEYALMIALLAVVITSSVALLGDALGIQFNAASGAIGGTTEQVGNNGSNGAGHGQGHGQGVGGGQGHTN